MRSLRGRLTLGVVAVLAVVLFVGGLSVSRYVKRTQTEAIDQTLQRTAVISRQNTLDKLNNSDPATPDAERKKRLDDKRIEDVLNGNGISLRGSFGLFDLKLGRPPEGPPSARDGFRTLEQEGRRYRVYTSSLSDTELSARLEVATRIERVERRQRALNRNLLLFGSLALLVAAGFTFFVANLVLRPLQRLRSAAASIAGSEDLDRRIPTDDGATELRALAESFDAMLRRLAQFSADRERALEATRRFAADAGHELRTPLTSVQANLSSLRRHPDIAVERRNGLLDDAMSEQHRLVSLLDGLQALARGDATTVEHTRVDLAELLDQTLEAARSRYSATTFDASLPDDPVEVEGWSPGLRLVLDNLVGNAAKHGRAGGTVRVTLAGAVAGADFTVEDDGAGIPEADRARVFEPFQRVEGTVVQGSGLGLALVAQQIRHHGAELELDASVALGGARFRVHFPDVAPSGSPGTM